MWMVQIILAVLALVLYGAALLVGKIEDEHIVRTGKKYRVFRGVLTIIASVFVLAALFLFGV